MYMNLRFGNLIEPLTGRRLDRLSISEALSQRLCHYHKNGVRPGDRVFLLYGNSLEFFVDLMAIWQLGGCVIPIDLRLTCFEIENLAKTANPALAIYQGNLVDRLASVLKGSGVNVLQTPDLFSNFPDTDTSVPLPVHRGSLEDEALILFTSGTTGNPKGVVHTHRSLQAKWFALETHVGVERFQRTLCLLPTHFGHGLICNCLYPWLSGQDLYVVPPFRTDLIMNLGRILDEHQITFMSSVPSLWRLTVKAATPPSISKLQSIFCGSAPLSAFLWNEIQKWSGISQVHNVYGITEVGSWLAGTTGEQFDREDGRVGKPWGSTIKIFKGYETENGVNELEECGSGEPGYVWVKSPALMKGYLGQDQLTGAVVKQGWFRTGDIGAIDKQGQLFLQGRVSEEINKSGMKVHPADIDSVAEQVEGVLDVCSFGYKDPYCGENIGIALTLEEPSSKVLANVYAWVVQHLAEYKIPLQWYLLDTIPRTSRGKVKRDQVAAECATRLPEDLKQLIK